MIFNITKFSFVFWFKKREAEAKFKEIAEAYSILMDKNKRQRFDSGVDLDDDGMGGFGSKIYF